MSLQNWGKKKKKIIMHELNLSILIPADVMFMFYSIVHDYFSSLSKFYVVYCPCTHLPASLVLSFFQPFADSLQVNGVLDDIKVLLIKQEFKGRKTMV